MYLGRIVEQAPTRELFANPKHPYTKALLSSIPSIDPDNKKKFIELKGEIPIALNPLSGCVFHTRYEHANENCKISVLSFDLLNDKNHFASCLRIKEF